jgi:Zn-dependent protease with chaperone function
MPASRIPYPPSPEEVPKGLTDYSHSYIRQQNLLLAGLFVFLILYVGLVLLFGMLVVWFALSLSDFRVAKLFGLALCGTFFLFLVKGFFKRPVVDKELHIEITETEHPVLFGFIHQLCEELGSPAPNRVFVSPDVNAAVIPRTTLINLFVEPKKDLLIGLGLVNCVNLSEFKAVLAHEFGHFSQSAMASSYTYVASRIIGDLIDGEDWFDRFIYWCKRQESMLAIFGHLVGGCLWIGRKVLEWLYKGITLQRLAVSREREFHADLVAVSAAGSNAVVHCLLRTDFGHQCFMQAIDDLQAAVDHKLYSNDLYLHQDHAAAVIRRKKKTPDLGLPPALNSPMEGKAIQVIDPKEDELADEIPPIWRTHPSNADRETNAKEQFVPAEVDHRSPWILFSNPAELKERMSYKFYRMVFRIPKNSELTDAKQVQQYIDNEHAETTYDPRYQGVYEDRPLEPGDLSELNDLISSSPWTDERIEKVYANLYEGCREHAEAHAELYKELVSLNANVVGKPSPRIKKRIQEIEQQLDENWEWFKSFDRRVYLLHAQMALRVNRRWHDELVERYRFQLEVQRLYQEARKNFEKADWHIEAYFAASRGQLQVPPNFGAEVIAVLRAAWKALRNIIQDAREINLPAMKNFEEGERLADFILQDKLVPEPPLSELKGAWVEKLMTQLHGVKNRCHRLHFKSVGGILALQEKIAAAWLATREPVTAEVVELGPAEVVPAKAVTELPIGTSQTMPVNDTRIHSPAGHLLPVCQPNVVPNENKPISPELPAPIVEADPNAVTPSTEDQTSSAHLWKRRPAVRITFVKPGEESPFAC